MKKLITLATACLSLGALVACGKGESEPAKTDWTDEEKELLSETLFKGMDFLPLVSSVEYDEDFENVVFTGEKGSDEKIAELGTVLEGKDFHEFVRGQYASYYLTTDLAKCHDFDEDYEVVEYFRFASSNIPASYVSYGPFGAFDLVAVGVDAESGNLVAVAAPMYMKFSYINLDYDGMTFYGVEQDSGNFLEEASGHVEETFFDLFAYDEEGTTSYFEEGVFAYPESTDSANDMFGLQDFAYMFPWSRGNMLSSSYSYEVGFDLVTGEESRTNLVDALLENGFEEGEHNETYKETSFIKAASEDGFYYVVTVGDYEEEHVEFSTGTLAGYSVSYTFFEYSL